MKNKEWEDPGEGDKDYSIERGRNTIKVKNKDQLHTDSRSSSSSTKNLVKRAPIFNGCGCKAVEVVRFCPAHPLPLAA